MCSHLGVNHCGVPLLEGKVNDMWGRDRGGDHLEFLVRCYCLLQVVIFSPLCFFFFVS